MAEQDYTTYTEVDGGTDNVTVAAQQIDCDQLTRNEETYLYKSFGASHFGDIDHIGSFVISDRVISGTLMVYALCNTPDDALAIRNGTGLVLRFLHAAGPDENRIYISYANAGSLLISEYYGPYTLGTRIWWRLTRSGSTIILKLYDDAARTNLLSTLSGTGDATTFEYHEPIAAWNDGLSYWATGVIYGTDFQESTFQAAWVRNSNQIIGVSQ